MCPAIEDALSFIEEIYSKENYAKVKPLLAKVNKVIEQQYLWAFCQHFSPDKRWGQEAILTQLKEGQGKEKQFIGPAIRMLHLLSVIDLKEVKENYGLTALTLFDS